jgi:transposase-like protein
MIFLNDLLQRTKRNKGAFSGNLLCPLCKSQRNSLVEKLTPFRYRYRCKDCKQTFQYDTSGQMEHPYAPLKKPKFQSLIGKRRG